LQRALQSGDIYRAPNLPNLTITTGDAGAIEVMFDGKSIGFVGRDGASVQHAPLMPAYSSNEADKKATTQEAVERPRSADALAMSAEEASAVARGLQAMAAEEAVERKPSAELSTMGGDEASAVATQGLSASEESADQAEAAQSADQARAAIDLAVEPQ
jgi:hypothetical protein